MASKILNKLHLSKDYSKLFDEFGVSSSWHARDLCIHTDKKAEIPYIYPFSIVVGHSSHNNKLL